MSEHNSISDDSYSDDDEEEELDPRIQDELEKLNAATNSINHLEAELDEARAVFRQTLASATYQLNGVAQKLGKCVEKSRPFYEAYRQLRQSHSMLQKSTNQFERATGMHVAAKARVAEAERRVFGGGAKRAFDSALQEMLNQATIEVNEAEKMKRDSWKKHQEDLRAYRDLESKVKQLYRKLRNSVDKAKPYFEQKKDFDRHLWQLKLRVDSIHLGLGGAKENYSACLKSLEVISDEIHEKRKKSKRMEAMIVKLQEREAGVGADSSTEDETSLSASNLDLDFDSNINFDKLDGISDSMSSNSQSWSLSADPGFAESADRSVAGCEEDSTSDTNLSVPLENRVVYGLESPEHEKNGKDSQKNKLLSNNESSLEKPNPTENASKSEDKPNSSIESETLSFTETEEALAVDIRSTSTADLPQADKNEVQDVSALENESGCTECLEKDEENNKNELASSSSDTLECEDNGTRMNDEGSKARAEKDEEDVSLLNESKSLENLDKETTEDESIKKMGTANEGNDVEEGEVQASETKLDQEKELADDKSGDFTTEVMAERIEKDETGGECEIKEKVEEDKEITNGSKDANATENATEQTIENESHCAIKEVEQDTEIIIDSDGATGKLD